MNAVDLLRMQLEEAHKLLESTVGDDVTPEQFHYTPQGRALPVGAAYAHVLFSEDILIQALKGEKPLHESGVRTGASEPMPNFMTGDWAGYATWTQAVRFDVADVKAYAQKVYANSDAYLATLSEQDLDKEDPLFHQSVGYMISRALIGHVDNLTGEVSAAKGLQGLQGYPF